MEAGPEDELPFFTLPSGVAPPPNLFIQIANVRRKADDDRLFAQIASELAESPIFHLYARACLENLADPVRDEAFRDVEITDFAAHIYLAGMEAARNKS